MAEAVCRLFQKPINAATANELRAILLQSACRFLLWRCAARRLQLLATNSLNCVGARGASDRQEYFAPRGRKCQEPRSAPPNARHGKLPGDHGGFFRLARTTPPLTIVR